MAKRRIAKLSEPRVYGAVPRERLFHRLDQCRQHPITFVVGAPGAGKSTLLATYVRARRLPTLWYHVDAGDRDPGAFFMHLRNGALALSRGAAGLPLFAPEFLADMDAFARKFFRSLFASLPENLLLALDDTQNAPPDSAFHRIVAMAAREAPEGTSIVSLSRATPDPAFAALLASQHAIVIEPEQLLLTEEETRELARRKHGLDAQAAGRLHALTRGWAAGVTLLAGHVTREQGPPASILSARTAADYFQSEIMSQFGDEDRMFLRRSALLPHVTRDSAMLLGGHANALGIVEQLHRKGLFADRQQGTEPSFRYHDLFREFLLGSLRALSSADQWRAELRRAGQVAREVHDAGSAVALLIDGDDLPAAADLIEEHARSLLETGRFQTLREWIERPGDSWLVRRPWLRLWYALALMATDIPKSREQLVAAFEDFEAFDDGAGQLAAAAQIINTHYYEYADLQPIAECANRIDALLSKGARPRSAPEAAELCAARLLAITWLGSADAAPITREAEALLAEPALNVNQRVSLGYSLFDLYTLQSRMADSRRIIDSLAPVLNDPQVSPLNRAYAHLQLGYHHLRRGEHDAAERAWRVTDAVSAEYGLQQAQFPVRVFRSFSCSSRGDAQGAEAQLRGLDAWVSDAQPLTGALYHIAVTLVALARADGPDAARHARRSLAHATRLGGGFVNVAWRAHGSAALAMAEEHEEAERWIEEGLRLASGTWLECYRTNFLMSRAYSLVLRGDEARAHAVITEMVSLARANDWWTYLRILPTVKDVVFREALRAGTSPEFVAWLVRELGIRPGSDPPDNWPHPIRVYTLGEFRLVRDDKAVTFTRKAQRRPLQLLKLLVAQGGRGVDTGRIAELLWTDADGDAAQDSLTMAVHRLRKLLGEDGAVMVREGKCSLDPDTVWVDVWALERRLDAIEADQPDPVRSITALRRLYPGHFLERESTEPWMLPLRHRLASRVQRTFAGLALILEQAGRWQDALGAYEAALELDPASESLYRGMIRCHLARGDRSQAVMTYQRCREMLTSLAGIQPSPETSGLVGGLGLAHGAIR